jgi:cell wall-associated NlpC family hydrolase
MFGIDLVEQYSITQSTLGTAVSEEDIRPGDLLFYVGRYAGQIGHVAIYIGNGKIIHAASEAKGICVSSWKYVPIVTIRDVIGDQ